MSFIKGCTEHLPDARITFDKFHVVWHANAAVDKMRRIEQREPSHGNGVLFLVNGVLKEGSVLSGICVTAMPCGAYKWATGIIQQCLLGPLNDWRYTIVPIGSRSTEP